jgi:general secretion pathway protein A
LFLQHFDLTEDPFGVTPDPRFLYFGAEHKEAVSSLYYSVVENRGFAAMVAGPGMGKTTLLNYLSDRVKDRADLAFVVCSSEDRGEMLGEILIGLGLPDVSGSYLENWRRFQQFLLERRESGRKVVLVCDEAQSASQTMLENLRLLSNLETTNTKLVQILLAGQPALAQKLQSPELVQLRQRINVLCQIRPLDEAEVARYVEHRLQVAGRRKRLFTVGAIQALTTHSQGVPRNINTLCYNSMAVASVLGRKLIDEEIVTSAVAELTLGDFSARSVGRRFGIRGRADSEPTGSSGQDVNGGGEIPAQFSEVLRKLEGLLDVLSKVSVAGSTPVRPASPVRKSPIEMIPGA